MCRYQNLYGYMAYFDKLNVEEACRWSGGEKQNGYITMSFPIYDDKLHDFIKEVYKTDLLDTNYMETLEQYQLHSEEDKKIQAIDTANMELVKAILTFYIRGERFCDGLWSRAMQDKVFYKLLVRLRQLEEGDDVIRNF